MSPEEQARSAIMQRWADSVGEDQRPPDLTEMTAIASAAGCREPEAVGLEVGQEALLIFLGVGWGVGPKARWRDRLRVRWAIFREARATRRPS